MHNKDKHWEGLIRGSLGKIKWNDTFSWHVNLSTNVSLSFSDLNHETVNYTLITRAICLQTPWMTLYYHKKSKPKTCHRKILFWWRYGCTLWQTVSTPSSFVADWYMLFVFWHSKSLLLCLMGACQKKRHRNNQYWLRYWHILLVTVVNSEQEMLQAWVHQSTTAWLMCAWWQDVEVIEQGGLMQGKDAPASESAISFSSSPICPGNHLNCIKLLGKWLNHLLSSLHICKLTANPECHELSIDALRAALLSAMIKTRPWREVETYSTVSSKVWSSPSKDELAAQGQACW